MDYPPPFAFSFPEMPITAKSLRIEKAANGFVLYLQQERGQQEVRIAFNMAVVVHIMQEYFKTPVNSLNDDTTGTS